MPMTNEGTWKRISRSDIGIDIVMEEAMGEKRSARSTEIQSKLQEKRKGKKKKKVSQVGNKSKQILVEAGFQPYQK